MGEFFKGDYRSQELALIDFYKQKAINATTKEEKLVVIAWFQQYLTDLALHGIKDQSLRNDNALRKGIIDELRDVILDILLEINPKGYQK